MVKINSKIKSGAGGFSTLEMMMAMTIMVIVLSAVVVVSFGNQSTLSGTQTNAEARNKAQQLLETEQAFGRKDFNLVNSTSTYDGFYTGNVVVTNPIISGKRDYFTKNVHATLSWQDERHITRTYDVSTLVANFGNTAGGDTCNSSPAGNWKAPTVNTYTVSSLAGVSGSYPIADADAYLDKLYVGVNPTTGVGDKTFFIFNLNNGVPSYISGSGIDTGGNTVTKGPNAILVVATTSAASGKTYAYIANSVAPDWSNPVSCKTASASCSQLQVVDVTNPASPSIVTNFKFATSTYSVPGTPPYVTGTAGQAVGNSLYYRNGYIFLGLTKTATGAEFQVIDVHDPLNPHPIGAYAVGATVNTIRVVGNYAYLTTDDSANILRVLDISDPTAIKPAGSPAYTIFPSSFGKGKGLALVGDTIYFGKTADPSTPEWYALNNQKPGTVAPSSLLTLDFGNTQSINKIIIRDYLAFLLMSPASQLYIRNATTTAQYASPISLPVAGSTLDCEGNYLYVGSSDSSGSITVVTGS